MKVRSHYIYRLLLAIIFILALNFGCNRPSDPQISFGRIESVFRNIPDTIQTSVYWYWISDNISEEGVIKDLQAMKKAGINRAFIGNIGLNNVPYGKVKIFSDEWWKIVHTALKTATELNIQIGIFNSPGWSQSGGPWIKPEQSMRFLNSTETVVEGPQQLSKKMLPSVPEFQQVKVIAFKAPSDFRQSVLKIKHQISSVPFVPGLNRIMDGDTSTFVQLKVKQDIQVDITTSEPATVRTLVIQTAKKRIKARGELYLREKNEFRKVCDFDINRTNPSLTVGFDPWAPIVISVPDIESNAYRLVIKDVTQVGAIAEIDLSEMPLVERYPEKSLAKMFQTPLPYWPDYLWPVQPEISNPSMAIDPQKIIDLTGSISADGTLSWNVPDGKWIIMQTGMTTTGVMNEPASPEGTGLEVDKMSRKHVASHFDAYLGEMIRRIPAEDRKSWKVVVEDSYERGGQNWTDGFIEEFKAKYGYDPVPYLPVFKGYVVGSRSVSDRFLWDLRRIVADKIAYDYVGGLKEISNKNGLTTWLENYGHWGFPGEFLQYGGQSDEVGGEFWSEGELGNIENRAASSCAHIYGKKKVSAESFTCGGAPFSRYPAKMKQRGDRFFTEGINNTLLHVYITQPYDSVPGMNAWFGNEFNRNNTWFSQMDLFTSYLKRTNFMLQQGNYVADVAYFIGEDVPKMTGICDPPLPKGYSFDYINGEVIMERLSVKDGRLALPDGMSYRLLVLPQLKTMRPELLKKIDELVRAGAVVMGPAPEYSPSLQNYPACDAEVKELASGLWGNVDGVNVKSAKAGNGMIISGMGMQEALDLIKVVPDCRFGETDPALFIHRRLPEGDIYFISNQSDKIISIEPEFRISGKKPEVWDPVTAAVRNLPAYSITGEITKVPVKLDAFESAFIVFRKKGGDPSGKDLQANYPDPVVISDLNGPWTMTFDKKMRGPVNPVVTDSLKDWTSFSNDSIKFYSGTVFYKTTFSLDKISGKRLFADLGKVKVMARVKLNGRDVGGVWTAPWRVDITGAVKKGENILEIEVVNNWVNRLIGDSMLPEAERKTWCNVNPFKPTDKTDPSGLTGPVKIISPGYRD
jgi:hypothetical protein